MGLIARISYIVWCFIKIKKILSDTRMNGSISLLVKGNRPKERTD